MVIEHTKELVAQGMDAQQFGSLMETELETLLNGVIISVVYDAVSTQVVALEGYDAVEAGDLGVFAAQGK